MRFIAPRVEESRARELADKATQRWILRAERAFSLIPSRKAPPAGLPRMELIWMPSHVYELALLFPTGPAPLSFSVDAHTGAFALFEMHSWVEEGTPRGAVFEPALDVAQAETLGRRELVSLLLRQRGRQQRAQPQPTETSYLVHFPVWIYYYARKGDRLDIIAIDGVTGERAASRRRAGILQAFQDAASSQGASRS